MDVDNINSTDNSSSPQTAAPPPHRATLASIVSAVGAVLRPESAPGRASGEGWQGKSSRIHARGQVKYSNFACGRWIIHRWATKGPRSARQSSGETDWPLVLFQRSIERQQSCWDFV
jgi:hypothetical protein